MDLIGKGGKKTQTWEGRKETSILKELGEEWAGLKLIAWDSQRTDFS